MAALAGDPIESISQVQGSAPVEIIQSANADGSVQQASFTIGLFAEDKAQCQARHPPATTGNPVVTCNPNRDDGGCGYFQCLIMADLALNPYYNGPDIFPFITATPYEDISIVEVVINVSEMTTLHWEWTYEAFHNSTISEFSLDLVAQDGSESHIIKPIAAPDDWIGTFASVRSGQYSTGTNVNDLELSRFWPNQKVRLRFALRNSYIPSYCNVLFPGFPLAGIDATGTSDFGMAKLIVNSLKINSGTCPVDPLPLPLDPIAQQFEDGFGPDTADLAPSMQAALSCLEAALGTDDSIVNSAFRPPSYQQHLYEVHQRWLELNNNTDPDCADLKAQIEAEELKHALVRSGAAPGNVGAHTRGLAVDLKNADTLVGPACTCGLYRRYAPAVNYQNPRTGHFVIDPPHFELNPGGKACL